MSDEPKDMTEVIRVSQELERLVGVDAPLRVRTLVEMLMIELERSMLAVNPPTEKSDARSTQDAYPLRNVDL